MKFGLPGGVTAGLVIRTNEVEILAMKGKTVASRVRVAIEGKEDHHLISAIRQAVEAAGLKTRRLAVSIPSQDVLFRFFTVPAVPKTELDAVVQFEARKYVPFKTDTLVWDYRAVPAKGSNQLEIVFSAVSKELFQQLQDALAAAGIQPVLVEPRSVSLARLVEPAKGAASEEFACVVEVERDAAHLAIVKNRLPYLTRDVVFAAAAEAPPEPPAAQEPAAQEPAAADASRAREVDPRGQRLLSELSVSMNFFLREYPSTTIGRVLVFGEEGVVGPWCGWLSGQLHRAVEMGNACVDPRVAGSLPLTFAPALGLLEAARQPAEASLNFLRRSAAKPAAGQRSRAGAAWLSMPELLAVLKTPQAVVCIGLAACALGGFWFLERRSVSAERDRLNQSIASRPDIGSALDAMSKEETGSLKEKAEAQLAFLKQVIDQRLRVAAKLDAVARALPDGVWITGLTFEDRMSPSGKKQFRMAIRGACFLGETGQELSAIHTFEEQVKRNPAFFSGFSVVQVDQIDAKTSAEQTYRAFQLNCNSERAL